MQYIQLKKDTYIVQTSEGPKTIHPYMLNFNKVLRLLKQNAKEEDILALLDSTELHDGIYEAYYHKDSNNIFYSFFAKEPKNLRDAALISLKDNGIATDISKEDCEFLGVYASLQDIKLEWPEYSL